MAKAKDANYINKIEFNREITTSFVNYNLKLQNITKEEIQKRAEQLTLEKRCKNVKEGIKFVYQIMKNESITPRAIELFLILATRTSNKMYYTYEEDKSDCIAFAIDDLIRYWTSFNPDKGFDAFAYFTSIAYTGLAKGWKKLYPEKYKGTISIHANGKHADQGIYTV